MTSLSKNARVAGLLYILASVVGVVRLLYIPTILIVHGNATATANNIVAHESLFRLGIVSQLLASVLWLFVPLALYRLLKEVDQALAVLMVILGSLMQVPIFFFNTVNDAAALLFARGGDFLTVFDKPQRDAFAMLFLRLHHQGDLANEIFWGLWLIPFGLLVYRSRFESPIEPWLAHCRHAACRRSRTARRTQQLMDRDTAQRHAPQQSRTRGWMPDTYLLHLHAEGEKCFLLTSPFIEPASSQEKQSPKFSLARWPLVSLKSR